MDNNEYREFMDEVHSFADGWYEVNLSSISDKKTRAIVFANAVHEGQTRKGKNVQYLEHPLAVMRILERVGADEDTIIAGVLHDTIEDCKPCGSVTRESIAEEFGDNVASIVDSVTEQNKSLPWAVRKYIALGHISSFSHESVLVKSADLISNVSEILSDYAEVGEKLWTRFNAPKTNLIHSYLLVISALLARWPESPLAEDLVELADKMRALDAEPPLGEPSSSTYN